MVDRSGIGALPALPEAGSSRTVRMRLLTAPARFLALLPALLAGMLCVRAAELIAAWPVGTATVDAVAIVVDALSYDVLTALRYLPLLFLLCLPVLVTESRRLTFWSLGIAGSALLLAQACLAEYFITARVPLGADLYTYTLREIRETVAGPHINVVLAAGTVAALLMLWLVLARQLSRHRAGPPPRATLFLFAVSLAALLFGPVDLPPTRAATEYAHSLSLNKTASFAGSSYAYLAHSGEMSESGEPAAASRPATPSPNRPQALDPRYPFLHTEQTPDDLGAHFNSNGHSPPNLVFLIVEGLGRSFSGPEASLGSFTPFLDELAAKSLYFENFLATQGRTFSVLPSIFGSLPFGEQGFSALDHRMPVHSTLLSVLKAQGYHETFFAGSDLSFDNERTFLARQGVEPIFERRTFGDAYPRISEWGYDDNELVSFALAKEAGDSRQPFVEILQTVTMHDPYRFLGQERFQSVFEQRLAQLGMADEQKKIYRSYRNIYTAILYTDDTLRRYFEAASKRPSFANTIFIVTGDHRLPEIPLAEWIDRYHVPLIIYSPLLKAPQRIKSISSHFDIAPSLLAFLAHGYGIRTPPSVTWIGSGLDLEPSFRNVHTFPMKQTKANLVDFIDGPWLLSRDALYQLSDGMHVEAVDNTEQRSRIAERFAAFRAANTSFGRTLTLMPPNEVAHWTDYAASPRRPLPPKALPTAMAVAVRDARVPAHAASGQLVIEILIANSGARHSALFIPLIVLQSADGREISETYGPSQTLAAGQAVTLQVPVKTEHVAAGRYFLSVYPSDPATGKRTGDGRFHIPIVIDG